MKRSLLSQIDGTASRDKFANISLLTETKNPRQKDKATASHLFTMAVISLSLFAAFIYVATIIGTGPASAAAAPEFDAANVIAIKKSASVGGFAIGSISMVAIGAVLLLSKPQKK